MNASGRGSRAADWLAAAGVAEPCVTETVDGGVCYATRYYTFPEGAPLPPFTVLQVSASPPDQQRIGYLALLENRRMVATLGSYGRSLVPLDEDGWTAFAESLPGGGAFARGLEHAVPETTGKNCAQQLLANANLRRTYPLVPGLVRCLASSERASYRCHIPSLTHFSMCSDVLSSQVHVGDARLALCPVYGQGITMAALGATSLASALGDATEATKSGRFATVADALHAAKYDGDHPAAAQGWALAAGTDAGFPHAAAKAAARAAAAAAAGGEVAPAPAPPAAAALPPPLRAFFAALRRTAGRDAAVWATFNGVAHLTKPSAFRCAQSCLHSRLTHALAVTALFHPAIVGRVAVAEVKRVLAGRT